MLLVKSVVLACSILLATSVSASWWWPFGSEKKEEPRLSELMEKASELIDEASDFASKGKVEDSVGKYREALEELEKVERENPERAATPEFASLRNKRAYIRATVDSMLMAQAHENAKAVAVTDTTALERKLAERRAGQREAAARRRADIAAGRKPEARPGRPERTSQLDDFLAQEKEHRQKLDRRVAVLRAKRLRKARALMGEGKLEEAERAIAGLLEKDARDVAALNLRAACEAMGGDEDDAVETLEKVIRIAPGDPSAYLNLASLRLRSFGDGREARRLYDKGVKLGGAPDAALERLLPPPEKGRDSESGEAREPEEEEA